MKAIIVRYLSCTNTRGSRYKASDMDKNSITLPADDALSTDGNKDAAARALCLKMGWTRHNLVRGGLPNGDEVFVFDADCNRVRVHTTND